jgi:hypothetical protein
MKNKACVTNLLETIDFVSSMLAEGSMIDIIFLDFLKAFDMVAHRRLLLKLETYGIKGTLLNWFRSFLENRRQRVILGDGVSSWSEVTSGVPQGSVLGPLLFVIYIYDLPECVSCASKLYADYSKLIRIVNNLMDAISLQEDIEGVTKWTSEWLNASKCKVIHLENKTLRTSYMVEDLNDGTNKRIEPTECEKDQGVFISSDFKWEGGR